MSRVPPHSSNRRSVQDSSFIEKPNLFRIEETRCSWHWRDLRDVATDGRRYNLSREDSAAQTRSCAHTRTHIRRFKEQPGLSCMSVK